MSLIEQATLSPKPSYRKIKLTKGQYAIVDAADYAWLNQWKWHARWNHHTLSYYAMRWIRPVPGGRQKQVHMHRVILDAPDGLLGDHINTGKTLDNRRHNLRLATRSQNKANGRLYRNSKSGLKGAYYHKLSGRWYAQIRVNKKLYNLGWFNTKEEAHAAYCAAAIFHHGEFARAA